MKGCETGLMAGQTGPELVERRVERRESRGGAEVGGAGVGGLRLFGGVNICSIPAIRCQGLMKALNMGPGEGGEHRELRRS